MPAISITTSLGVVATLAVLVHEVPHHMGDLIVLRQSSSGNRRAALVKVSLADLIPQLQKRATASETAVQIAWLALGIALVTLISGLVHAH